MTRVHLTLQARPQRRDELLAALDRLELAAAADDAYLIEVEVEASLDDPDRALVVCAWPTPEHYERWQRDHGWEPLFESIEPLLAAEPDVHAYRMVDLIR
jgi:quinol monooxygenase YgiN